LQSELGIDCEEVVFTPSDDVVENKQSLKVIEEGFSMNSTDNLMIASIEGELTSSEQNKLETILEDKAAQYAYKVYQHTILEADLSEKFENKKSLKRKQRKVIPFYFRLKSYSLVLLMCFFPFKFELPDFELKTNIFINVSVFIS